MSYKSDINYFVKDILKKYDYYHTFSNFDLAMDVMVELVKIVPDAHCVCVGSSQYICLTSEAYSLLMCKLNSRVSKLNSRVTELLEQVDSIQSVINQPNPFGD